MDTREDAQIIVRELGNLLNSPYEGMDWREDSEKLMELFEKIIDVRHAIGTEILQLVTDAEDLKYQREIARIDQAIERQTTGE